MRFDILLIEDNPGDARLIKEMMAESVTDRYVLDHVDRLSKGLEKLSSQNFDAVLLDLTLPDSRGLNTPREVLLHAPNVPIVILSSLNHELLAYQALSEGAQDYLVKGMFNSTAMLRSLRHAMARHRLQSTVHGLALMDDLTGLYTRRGFLHVGDQHLKIARRAGRSFSVAAFDLDGFKQINDAFGHSEGNRALMDAARILRRCFRQSDTIGRLGGDEFAVLIADSDEVSVQAIFKRLVREQDLINANDRGYKISFSAGIVYCCGDPVPALEELLAQADARMYEQKRAKAVDFPISMSAQQLNTA
jgi:diguanylate cyclase (GGDEF)-like protein